jgi:lipase ATG15
LVVVPRPLSAAAYAGASPAYLELSSRRLNSTIIAVRGTDVGRLRDFMEDVNLYAEAVVFSMLSAVFPTIRLWTHDTTSRVIEWLYESNSFFGLASEAEYYQPLTDRVKELQQQQKTGSVVLTGHSLGGGLARIVGTLTYAPSVSFSPPGLRLSYRKYSEGPAQKRKHDGSSLLHESVTVVSEFDWITSIDVQVGLVQQILCDHSDKAHLLACHLLEPTICNILSHCGDPRFTHCESTFDLKSLRHVFSHWGWLGLTTTVLLIFFTLGLAILPEIM